jgi:sugar phosphate isomerase/epimerase
MFTRREFAKTLASMAAVGPLAHLPAGPLAAPLRRIGVQLYTVRDSMRADVPGTLARVRGIGYREVEFAGYFGRTPKQLRADLRANGLTAPACHVGLDSLTTGLTATLDAAEEIGHRWVILPWIDRADRTPAGIDRIADQLNAAGEAAARRRIRIGYHNHDFELHPWEDGEIPLERLIRRLDPRHTDIELDLYWVIKGGSHPLRWMELFPGRFPLVHVKDAGRGPEFRQADVGSGDINWRIIFERRRHAGIRHYFIEHDEPADPWASITTSYRYLSTLDL